MSKLDGPGSPPKRSGQRYRAGLPAVVHVAGAEHECAAENLSRTGVLLVGRFPAPDAADLTVHLYHPSGDLALGVRGRVVFFQPGDAEASSKLGLEFERIDEGQARVLEDLVSRVVEGMAPAALETLSADAPLEVIRAALAKVSVAHRVTLAARALPPERELLRHDTEPAVLEALARNPQIILPEIKSLLRRTDLLPATLDLVANDPRWFGDDEVKVLIATHPRVTFTTADRVVSRMTDLGLEGVIRRPGLQPGVKQKLMQRLAKKHRRD